MSDSVQQGNPIMSTKLSLTGLLVVNLLASVAIAEPGKAQEDEDKLWEAFRKAQQESAESFEKTGLAVASSRKLLGLTRREVEAKLGKPSSADWFVHATKPRFMGDRVRYTR